MTDIDPKDIVSVSVMPCTAKKFEIGRDDQSAAGEGIPDLDISITTRELGYLIKKSGLKFEMLPDEEFDDPMERRLLLFTATSIMSALRCIRLSSGFSMPLMS